MALGCIAGPVAPSNAFEVWDPAIRARSAACVTPGHRAWRLSAHPANRHERDDN